MIEPVQYQPGVCNIGGAEAAQRRGIGFKFLALSVAAAAALWAISVPAGFFLLLALPLFISATGFIQAQRRFCSGYGRTGLYNFGDTVGKYEQASDPAARAKDKRTAVRITIQAALIGVVLAVILVALRASL